MFIQTEATPNPDTLKFLPGQEIAPETPRDFATPRRGTIVFAGARAVCSRGRGARVCRR